MLLWKSLTKSSVEQSQPYQIYPFFTVAYTFALLNIGIPSKGSSHMLRHSVQIGTFCLHFLHMLHVLWRHLSTHPSVFITIWWTVGSCSSKDCSASTYCYTSGNQCFTHYHQQKVSLPCLHKSESYFLSFLLVNIFLLLRRVTSVGELRAVYQILPEM